MDDDVVFRQQLERRIAMYRHREATLQGHLAEIEAELEEVRRRRGSAEQLYETEFGAPFSGESTHERPAAAVGAPRGPLTGLSWADALIRVLDEHGPAHIKVIWEFLQGGGFRTDARDPLRSIVAIAVRLDPSVVRTAPNTYALSNGRQATTTRPEGQLEIGGDRG